ncbi:MAG: type II secretion system F family protein [Abditibacteriales bacterium]|nr:type II secretion system F family protein [Abditibacteriales bacterium]MDW8365162.1 type II secretion system F family protein [Abditibacteriales bacterium]
MPTFAYVARDAAGRIHRGRAEADNERNLQKRLRESGYFVTEIRRESVAKPGQRKGFLTTFQKVKLHHLALFCRQFATMINAGVSLVRCLAVLEQQTPSARMRQIIRELQTDVEAGEMLSKSMAKHPRVFDNLFIGLVRAGEVGGVLDETMERLSQFLEKIVEMRRKIKSAMTYPIIVFIVALLIVNGLVIFILPKFMEIFKEFKVDMPAMTQFLMDVSNFMRSKQGVITLVVAPIVAYILFRAFIRTKWGKRIWDWMKLKFPVFGKLNHNLAIARFARTLSTLLTSGVPILQAMETTAGAVNNDIVADAIMESRASIREGERIGDPLEKSKLFPPMVVQMIAIGEETGTLDNMLGKVADYYESEVDAQLQSLASAIEPMMIVFLGFIVGFIVIAMFLPLISIISQLSQ